MIGRVEVVVAAPSLVRIGDAPGQGVFEVALDDLAQVVDVREGAGDGREQQHPPVGMLVDEDVVEAAGHLRLADARHLFDRRRIGQPGHVEHHRAEVGVGAALSKLQRLHDVVAPFPFEVFHVHPAGAHVQVLVLDAPAIDHLEVARVREIDDVGAARACIAVDHPGDVGVGAVEFLLQLYIGHAQPGSQWDVAEHFDVVATRFLRRPLRCRALRPKGEDEQGDDYVAARFHGYLAF